jgi:hypothetical protein
MLPIFFSLPGSLNRTSTTHKPHHDLPAWTGDLIHPDALQMPSTPLVLTAMLFVSSSYQPHTFRILATMQPR